MGTPASKRKIVDLSRYAEVYRNLKQAEEDKKKLDAYIAGLKDQLKKAVGKADGAKIDGVLAFTFAPSDSYAVAKFAEEYPEIAEQFKVEVVKETIDVSALLKTHPTLLEPFRTRVFLVK